MSDRPLRCHCAADVGHFRQHRQLHLLHLPAVHSHEGRPAPLVIISTVVRSSAPAAKCTACLCPLLLPNAAVLPTADKLQSNACMVCACRCSPLGVQVFRTRNSASIHVGNSVMSVVNSICWIGYLVVSAALQAAGAAQAAGGMPFHVKQQGFSFGCCSICSRSLEAVSLSACRWVSKVNRICRCPAGRQAHLSGAHVHLLRKTHATWACFNSVPDPVPSVSNDTNDTC